MANPQIKSGSIADHKKEEKNELVFSYLTLRNLIGFSGILLPLVLAIAPKRPSDYYGFEPSISDYFYTDRGDILVVVLCILGAFLITYTGYTWKEQLLTFVAGVCGIGVAFVPTKMDCLECNLSVHTGNGGVFSFIAGTGWHFGFAATFFLCLAIMSLVYFTLGNDDQNRRKPNGKLTQKAIRNIVFRICGWVIIGSLVVLGLYFIIKPDLGRFPIVFAFETLAVFAFGFSWVTKGQTLWPDGEHYLAKGVKNVKNMLK
ncbi:DUF998 domain-containing protein [Pedobacter polaris]|uniref:DUF998 domain-containing protein n=1 Tax=Pedobacter polaris TaxID=2571273 RepID=A0A4U1CRK6_9SPHI|nr:DUF998 domain-containing protein [Pedobacter polaris]TKC10701.1 DUF998 domain-containing protein [Pedobacter polaris]